MYHRLTLLIITLGGKMLDQLDLTELTFIQCLLKTSMDELERNPDINRELTAMFTLETARSVEMKIERYIDNMSASDEVINNLGRSHGYR